ncbi:hypothetical protein SteCoe_36736 [Stentor coeruleus]|uniref:Uncharacterized protein n=1 Tax=Stentor coeruleus TaxID=5963 RepID=A0A1R2APF4_9CILI|nr:hypothetical protein SteCoe_36736 [Stentor coeruleus]
MISWLINLCCNSHTSPKHTNIEVQEEDNYYKALSLLNKQSTDVQENIFGFKIDSNENSEPITSPRFGGIKRSDTGGTKGEHKKKSIRRKKLSLHKVQKRSMVL